MPIWNTQAKDLIQNGSEIDVEGWSTEEKMKQRQGKNKDCEISVTKTMTVGIIYSRRR